MDNRWRFLYYVSSEMWGRMQRALAGRAKTGAKTIGVRLANLPYKPRV